MTATGDRAADRSGLAGESGRAGSPVHKIVDRNELLARFGPDHRERAIVFTNGCFDLVHAGHVEFLCSARELGDALVVGMNTDASVRRLKGTGRPLVPQSDRAFVLAGLGCVDAVTLFDEDTPLELITVLRPDVLVKGADYRAEDVVGRREVEERGGRLVLLPYREGYSTSDLVRRIRALE